jgi:hypothetical protein
MNQIVPSWTTEWNNLETQFLSGKLNLYNDITYPLYVTDKGVIKSCLAVRN